MLSRSRTFLKNRLLRPEERSLPQRFEEQNSLIAELQDNVSSLEQRLASRTQINTGLEKTNADLLAELQSLRTTLEQHQLQAAKSDDTISALQHDLAASQALAEERSGELDQLRPLPQRLSETARTIDELHLAQDAKDAIISRLENDLQRRATELHERTAEGDRLRRQCELLAEEQRDALDRHEESLQRVRAEWETERDDWRARMAERDTCVERLEASNGVLEQQLHEVSVALDASRQRERQRETIVQQYEGELETLRPLPRRLEEEAAFAGSLRDELRARDATIEEQHQQIKHDASRTQRLLVDISQLEETAVAQTRRLEDLAVELSEGKSREALLLRDLLEQAIHLESLFPTPDIVALDETADASERLRRVVLAHEQAVRCREDALAQHRTEISQLQSQAVQSSETIGELASDARRLTEEKEALIAKLEDQQQALKAGTARMEDQAAQLDAQRREISAEGERYQLVETQRKLLDAELGATKAQLAATQESERVLRTELRASSSRARESRPAPPRRQATLLDLFLEGGQLQELQTALAQEREEGGRVRLQLSEAERRYSRATSQLELEIIRHRATEQRLSHELQAARDELMKQA